MAKIYKSVETIHFDSAAKFLDYLRPTHDHWGKGEAVEWLFRGQADYTWPLVPRAWRDRKTSALTPLADPFAKYLRADARVSADSVAARHRIPKTGFHRLTDYLGQIAAEYDAVKHFALFADEISYLVPGSAGVSSGRDFILALPTMTSWPDVEPNDAFGIAQHHGIPTRLLDWSRRGSIAAYFASQIPQGVKPSRIAVWAMNVPFLHDIDPKYGLRKLASARAQDSYLEKQEGLFVWFREGGSYFWKNGSWPSFSDVVERAYTGGDKPLRFLTLRVAEVRELEALLWRERISLAHLMPTHDNVARVVIKNWATYRGMRVAVTAYGN